MQAGLEVREFDNGELVLSMERFCLGVEPIDLNTERRKKEDSPATPSDTHGDAAHCRGQQWRGNKGH